MRTTDRPVDQRPTHVAPMQAVRSTAERCKDGFAYELCYDGLRCVAHLTSVSTRLESTRYRDLTGRYPELANLHETVGRDAILDGEIVVAGEGGPDAQRLQRRRQDRSENGVLTDSRLRDPVTYVVHDVLWLDGEPVCEQPYQRRRDLLEQLELGHPHAEVGPRFEELTRARERARSAGVRGLLAKRLGSQYRVGKRSPDWRLLAFVNREDFVVGGYIPGQGQRSGSVGALLVGQYPHQGADKLRYAGAVGTGFTESDLAEFGDFVSRAQIDTSPFLDEVPREDVRWCEPELVVRVQYREETDAGLLRYPVYKGVSVDVDPADVVG